MEKLRIHPFKSHWGINFRLTYRLNFSENNITINGAVDIELLKHAKSTRLRLSGKVTL